MKKLKITMLIFLAMSLTVSAQWGERRPLLENWRPNDKRGLNVYEDPVADTVAYEGFLVRIGGDFAMQFQGLSQSNDAGDLVELGSDFNLPVANLNMDVQLMEGMRMHLRMFLSSRHHTEAWIKGGHMQISNLNFISEGLLENLMQYIYVTVGLDEFNYGDAHFRRSDNARTIFNPFVGNYIMDSYSTEAFGELTVMLDNGFLGVVGLTNGKLNQNVVVNPNTDNQPSFYGKLGYDQQFDENLRIRLTGSWYINQGTTSGTWLYGGDRAGSRYYSVLHTIEDGGGDFDGRFNARFTKLTALQLNPFIKYGGLEFFGVIEQATGGAEFADPQDEEGSFTQLAGELLYRFGNNERFYVGGRYNVVTGKMRESMEDDMTINRFNVGAGWFLNRNVITKIEYVNQVYDGDAWAGRFAGAEFNGVVIEAAISF